MQNKRLVELDIFKGWAIVLMILYHFIYDLNYFHYIHEDLDYDLFWLFWHNTIVTMFVLAVGMSFSIAHRPSIRWDKVQKRTLFLGIASALITLITYFLFPQTWVYFGILHFILVSSIVGLLFLPYPFFSLCLALGILGSFAIGWIDMHWLFKLLKEPLQLPRVTEDLVRFIPWFAVMLLGMSLVNYGYHEKVLKNKFLNPSLKHNKLLAYFGKHAFLIYLLHLPLLFGLFYGVELIK